MQNHKQRTGVGVGVPLVGEHQTTTVNSLLSWFHKCEYQQGVLWTQSAWLLLSSVNVVHLWRWMSGPAIVILATDTVFPKWCLAAVTNSAEFYVHNHWAVYWALHKVQWTHCLCHSVTGDYSTLFDSRPRRTPAILLHFLLCSLVDSVLEDRSKTSNFDCVQNTTRQNAALEIIKSGWWKCSDNNRINKGRVFRTVYVCCPSQ